jgi:hypothetical protein
MRIKLLTSLPAGVRLLSPQELILEGYRISRITLIGNLVTGDSLRWRDLLGPRRFDQFLSERDRVVRTSYLDFSCGKAAKLESFAGKPHYVPADLELKISRALESFLDNHGITIRW